ncbi:biotin--[acetyl-CoA-carboxylase] ligase [Caldalkalibacillus salinus]|uniref:biotin--[acetyl-CoA-carboxylase] ligase n=1 Tax=Caldalkalibacillus salinus TaxID=2803787 RepID=UPI001922350E|nr:biotin--[acetyl-CoA-carboxylase] ligase [Caldalkalibacillus salinus]
MNESRRKLVSILQERKGTFVSGEELSHQLEISRTAIWKHIEELRKDGYHIQAVRKQGYQLLQTPTSLTASNLVPYLKTETMGHHLYHYDEVTSTQLVAHEKAREGAPSGTVVLAEHQTQGKGRLNRKWHSPAQSGVWMSVILRLDIPLSSVSQVTLLSSVAVLKGIKNTTGKECQIKWPNDLLLQGKKLAGILTELNAETDRLNYVIVGVGMNVNQSASDFPEELQHIATSLKVDTGEEINRKSLVLNILKEWEVLLDLYMAHGFSPIKTLWETYTSTIGKQITARTREGQVAGIARGINEDGVLLLEDASGMIHRIYSADIETPPCEV